jgi:hypothetical protein
MTQERFNDLTMIALERHMLEKIDDEFIMEDIVSRKHHKNEVVQI